MSKLGVCLGAIFDRLSLWVYKFRLTWGRFFEKFCYGCRLRRGALCKPPTVQVPLKWLVFKSDVWIRLLLRFLLLLYVFDRACFGNGCVKLFLGSRLRFDSSKAAIFGARFSLYLSILEIFCLVTKIERIVQILVAVGQVVVWSLRAHFRNADFSRRKINSRVRDSLISLLDLVFEYCRFGHISFSLSIVNNWQHETDVINYCVAFFRLIPVLFRLFLFLLDTFRGDRLLMDYVR